MIPSRPNFLSSRNVKGSQEVVDFVSDRLREQRKNGKPNLTQICEEVNLRVYSLKGLKRGGNQLVLRKTGAGSND